MYEFAGAVCEWGYNSGFLVSPLPNNSGETWNAVKESQLRSGSTNEGTTRTFSPHLFPSVRCFYHWGTMWGKTEYVLNTAYEGTTFPSLAEWELGVYEGK